MPSYHFSSILAIRIYNLQRSLYGAGMYSSSLGIVVCVIVILYLFVEHRLLLLGIC